ILTPRFSGDDATPLGTFAGLPNCRRLVQPSEESPHQPGIQTNRRTTHGRRRRWRDALTLAPDCLIAVVFGFVIIVRRVALLRQCHLDSSASGSSSSAIVLAPAAGPSAGGMSPGCPISYGSIQAPSPHSNPPSTPDFACSTHELAGCAFTKA